MHAKFLSNKRAEVEHGKRRWTYIELDKKKVICIQKQSELRTEIKYPTNAFKIFYFIICSGLRTLVQLEKCYQ